MFSVSIPADTVFGRGNRGCLQKNNATTCFIADKHSHSAWEFHPAFKMLPHVLSPFLITEQYKNEIFILAPPVSEILKLHQ